MDIFQAFRHCLAAHEGQRDKIGEDYWKHPFKVMLLTIVKWGYDEDTCVAALLHDVWEDTDYALPLGGQTGLTDVQYNALIALTRGQNEAYKEFIKRLVHDRIACKVKYGGDLPHNMSPERHEALPDNEKGIMERYEWAYSYVEEFYIEHYKGDEAELSSSC